MHQRNATTDEVRVGASDPRPAMTGVHQRNATTDKVGVGASDQRPKMTEVHQRNATTDAVRVAHLIRAGSYRFGARDARNRLERGSRERLEASGSALTIPDLYAAVAARF